MPSLLGLQPPTLLQAVLDNVGVALAVIDREGKFVFTNQAALRMFGEVRSLDGVSLLDWRRRHRFQDSQGRDIPAEKAPVLRALAGEEIEPQDVRMTLPDGRVKWLHAAGHSFSVLGLTGVFVIITDETEQIELRRAMEGIQRMEAVGLLAGALAHDFNHVLSVISENVALALTDQGVPETTCARLQHMKSALQKGATLATRLVQYSRTQEFQAGPLQINEAVSDAVDLVRPLLGSSIRLKIHLRPDLPCVEADPSRIEQVLVNLILNALDAMPEGGELALQTEIADSAGNEGKKPAQFVLVTVTDTGTGIPANLQARIFDPFFTTKPSGKGAGLGLSSAYLIVRQHHGDIKVQSAPDVGTKFSVYLPVKESSSPVTEKMA